MFQPFCRFGGRRWAAKMTSPKTTRCISGEKRAAGATKQSALPISFRPALLGRRLATIANPDTLNAVRDQTILRRRRAFERPCETDRLEAQAAKQGHQM